MKTLYTALPFYDRLIKQCYQRSERTNKTGEMYPILSARHRLPSFLINTEADAPGEITDVKFYNKTGIAYTKDSRFYGWLNYSAAWDTFTLSGLDITNAVQLNNADAYAICRNYSPDTGGMTSGSYKAKAGETINIKGTYTHNSGAVNRLCIFDIGFTEDYGENLVTGAIDFTYTFPADGEFFVLIHQPTTLASAFSFTGVEIGIDNGISFFQTTDSYIQGVPGGAWSSATYDTFTCPAAQTAITSAIKTTAAGEANCYNTVAVGSVPTGIIIGEKLRIVVDLTLNSGTAPKIVLRNTGTGAAISNIVTLANGVNYVFLIATATLATGWAIYIYNSDTEVSNWSATFTDGAKSVLPHLLTAYTDDYFQYAGATLGKLLPVGIYYLVIETEEGYFYYSDWFEATCVYENLISSWTNAGYDTLTSSGTAITSAIEAGVNPNVTSDTFSVIKGEEIRVVFFHTQNSGELPRLVLYGVTLGASISGIVDVVAGLNDITFTSSYTITDAVLDLYNTIATNFSTSEILVIRQYSEKYLTINFQNSCDIGDMMYEAGFEQTMFLNSEPMEQTYPTKEEGQENGEGKFVRTFARQVKKYNCKAGSFPDYMIDVFNRMKLYDDIELIDTVGNVNQVHNLEAEHEWLPPGKYYANINLTFDYDEAVVVMACCVNLSEL